MILQRNFSNLRNLKSQLIVYILGRVAKWIRHQTSDLGIAGSSPVTVDTFFFLYFFHFFLVPCRYLLGLATLNLTHWLLYLDMTGFPLLLLFRPTWCMVARGGRPPVGRWPRTGCHTPHTPVRGKLGVRWIGEQNLLACGAGAPHTGRPVQWLVIPTTAGGGLD